VPKFADIETSFDELQQRLARVSEFVRGIDPDRIGGSEEREIVITIGRQPKTFNGRTFLVSFALPNFYFHLTTAYAILRHNGIAIGKRDFLGPIL
jgi:hypothetical protein